MKLLRYFIRGIEEIARELGIIKSVVKPKEIAPPRPGRTDEVLRYISKKHSLRGISLFDPNGTLISSTIPKGEVLDLFSLLQPLLEETEAEYVFLKRWGRWITLFKRRDFILLVISDYQPDIVDIWVIGRDFERYMWGFVWEG